MGFTFFCYSVQMLTKVNGRLLEVKPVYRFGKILLSPGWQLEPRSERIDILQTSVFFTATKVKTKTTTFGTYSVTV